VLGKCRGGKKKERTYADGDRLPQPEKTQKLYAAAKKGKECGLEAKIGRVNLRRTDTKRERRQ